jgi:uncharacterized membrane protein YeaQ/YmgE (transglycosylase-associated protein family)
MNVSDILGAIIVGAVVGILGRLVLPGRQRLGAFATFIIGIGAALLGIVLSRAFGWNKDAPAHLWFVHWHWYTLAIQVGLAVILIGLANIMTYTRLADAGTPPAKRARRRRTSSSRS